MWCNHPICNFQTLEGWRDWSSLVGERYHITATVDEEIQHPSETLLVNVMGLLYGGFQHHQVAIKPSNWTIKSVLLSTCSPLGSSNWLFIVLLEYAWNSTIGILLFTVYTHRFRLGCILISFPTHHFSADVSPQLLGLGGQIGKTWQTSILPTSLDVGMVRINDEILLMVQK